MARKSVFVYIVKGSDVSPMCSTGEEERWMVRPG